MAVASDVPSERSEDAGPAAHRSGLRRLLAAGPWEFRLRTFSHYGLLGGVTWLHVVVQGGWERSQIAPGGAAVNTAIALALLGMGIAMRTWALSALPAGTSLSLSVRTEVRVTGGPYRLCPHPIYAGGTLTFLAFGWFLHPAVLAALAAAALVRYVRLGSFEQARLSSAVRPPAPPPPDAPRLTFRFWTLTELRFVGYAVGFVACHLSGDVVDLWPAIGATTAFEGLLVALHARYLRVLG